MAESNVTQDWRCVNCKRIVTSEEMPESCIECHCRTLAKVADSEVGNVVAVLRAGAAILDTHGVCEVQGIDPDFLRKAADLLDRTTNGEDEKAYREALTQIAEDFGDFPPAKFVHHEGAAWRHMAIEQQEIARNVLATLSTGKVEGPSVD